MRLIVAVPPSQQVGWLKHHLACHGLNMTITKHYVETGTVARGADSLCSAKLDCNGQKVLPLIAAENGVALRATISDGVHFTGSYHLTFRYRRATDAQGLVIRAAQAKKGNLGLLTGHGTHGNSSTIISICPERHIESGPGRRYNSVYNHSLVGRTGKNAVGSPFGSGITSNVIIPKIDILWPSVGEHLFVWIRVVFIDIHRQAQALLAKVALAFDDCREFFAPGQSGKQQTGQYRYDCNDNQQLNQGKCTSSRGSHRVPISFIQYKSGTIKEIAHQAILTALIEAAASGVKLVKTDRIQYPDLCHPREEQANCIASVGGRQTSAVFDMPAARQRSATGNLTDTNPDLPAQRTPLNTIADLIRYT